MTAGDQPLVGWRLWRLYDGRLRSWAVDNVWKNGPNEARCISPSPVPGGMCPPRPARRPCDRSPGSNCRCGLWAVWDLGSCINRARREAARWQWDTVVVGLVAGWGTVAIHGDEGFRCQHASVVCLFTDTIAGYPPVREGWRPRWWVRLARRMGPERAAASRLGALRRTASSYGIPLLSLADAVRLGALSEFGVPGDRVSEVEAQIGVH